MSSTQSRSNSGRWLLVALVALGCVGVALLAQDSAPPYDVSSTDPEGMRGLQMILEADGSTIENISANDVDDASVERFDTVLIPAGSGASSAQVERWRAYVRAGGNLVLGSPVDEIGARRVDEFGDQFPVFGEALSGREPGVCTIASIQDAGDIKITGGSVYLDTRDATSSCYGTASAALIAESADGVVTLGVPDLFVNQSMGQPEVGTSRVDVRGNAVVASRLLSPGGPARIGVVNEGLAVITATSGEGRSPLDFIRPGIKAALWQLPVALAFFVWSRARRHGRIVREPAATPIAASELVGAVGNLLERQGDAGNAAGICRASVSRELGVLLGLGVAPDPAQLAGRIAQRTGRRPEQVLGVFAAPVHDNAALLDVTRSLESIRQEVQGVRPERVPT